MLLNLLLCLIFCEAFSCNTIKSNDNVYIDKKNLSSVWSYEMKSNKTTSEKLHHIFKEIDDVDEVMRYPVEFYNNSARRNDWDYWKQNTWNGSKTITDVKVLDKYINFPGRGDWIQKGEDGYLSLFKQYLPLCEQLIYEARYNMAVMQKLREQYYHKGEPFDKLSYELGFSISKAYYLYKLATVQYYYSNIHIYESSNLYNYLRTLYIHERQVRARLDFDLIVDYIHRYDENIIKAELIKFQEKKKKKNKDESDEDYL